MNNAYITHFFLKKWFIVPFFAFLLDVIEMVEASILLFETCLPLDCFSLLIFGPVALVKNDLMLGAT